MNINVKKSNSIIKSVRKSKKSKKDSKKRKKIYTTILKMIISIVNHPVVTQFPLI